MTDTQVERVTLGHDVSLIEMLRSVPLDARLIYDWDTHIGSSAWPIGKMAHEAAYELEAAMKAKEGSSPAERLIATADALSKSAFTQYRDRDGNLASIEGDDGERAFIVPFDEMVELRAALSTITNKGMRDE